MKQPGHNHADASLVVGIDLGTTVLKAAAFDSRSGAMLARESVRLPLSVGDDGRREQDPQAMLRALGRIAAAMRRRLGTRWRRVAALGVAAQGGSAIVADRVTGRAHSPMYLWNDMRFAPYMGQVRRAKPLAWWRTLSWRDEPGAGLARMLWLQDTQPRLLVPGRIYAGAGDYLVFHLTGQWRQDAGNALQQGCFNVARRQLDERPLRLVDRDLSYVAPLRSGHEHHGLTPAAARMLGLGEGVQVYGPYMDHEAGYLAAANASSRATMHMSLGTAWVANLVLPPRSSWKSPFQLVIPSPCPADTGWLVVQPMLTGNVTWDWALTTLADPEHSKALDLAAALFAERLLPPGALQCVPWLNMPNPLWPSALGAGTFFGVSASTSRADLLRAVAAGMVFETARILAGVQRAGAIERVVLGGGASKGAWFQQLHAAALAPLELHVLADEDWAGARGAVAAVSAKAGRAATRRLPRPPRALLAQVREAKARYNELFEILYGRAAVGGALRLHQQGAAHGH